MTTLIYYFLMSLTLFIVPQLMVKFLRKTPNIDLNIVYLIFAAVVSFLWVMVPKEILDSRSANFVQHAVGGGVAAGFVSIYFIKTLKDIYPLLNKFPVQLILVYSLVSMLGVANELLEFILDFTNLGIFSADRYDTWYDLVANSLGAFSLFLIYSILSNLRNKIKSL